MIDQDINLEDVLEDGEEAYEPAGELRIEERNSDADQEPDSPHENKNALVNLSGSRVECLKTYQVWRSEGIRI